MKDYVLYVGQMFPRRHARETILACKKLGVELIMVGIDKYPEKLDFTGIEHHDRVSDEKLEELYRNARLFVYVSDTEAFGLPPLEALAHGVRPIVADTDIAHELLGDDAIYTQPSVDGIADAIRRGLASTKPEPMIKFTWQTHTDRFLELCKKLAN
ncbi:MAG: glycosyltransferase [Patescibacteria group bacterium]